VVFLVQVESAKLYGKSATLPIADFIFYTHNIQNVDFITPCNFVIEVSIELCTIASDIFKWASISKL